MSDRVSQIRAVLEREFAPVELDVLDQSHLHAGHPGARDGRGHFKVRIVSARFAGMSRIVRHRMIHDALAELLRTDIHALSLKALTPGEGGPGG